MTAVSGVPVSACFLDDVPMSDWGRLGRYVIARRVKLGYKQRGEFAAAVGVSSRVLSDIENGKRGNFDSVTIASLEDVLGWETGSAMRVAGGHEPALRSANTPIDVVPRSATSPVSDEIEMIYASRTMSPRQKLEAIRMVLHLREQADAEAAATGAPHDANANADVDG